MRAKFGESSATPDQRRIRPKLMQARVRWLPLRCSPFQGHPSAFAVARRLGLPLAHLAAFPDVRAAAEPFSKLGDQTRNCVTVAQ
jgi:hypothetical protein